jgi:MSHA biogenesis protein MshM
MMHRVTRGTPRLTNIIAHKALMLAFAEGRQQVQTRHVRKAAADTPEARKDWMVWLWLGGATAALLMLGVWGILLR